MENCIPNTHTVFTNDNFSIGEITAALKISPAEIGINAKLITTEGKLPITVKIFYNGFLLAETNSRPFATKKSEIENESDWVELSENKIYVNVLSNNECYSCNKECRCK